MNAKVPIIDAETGPLPDLPLIAKFYFQKDKIDEYSYAIADVLCWLDGFQAGGGQYGPQTIETLRNLSDALKSIQNEQATSNQSHT